MLNKKISLSNENNINRRYKRSIWQFYNAYNLACSILGFKDTKINMKNSILSRFIKSNEGTNSILFRQIQKMMNEDNKIIIKAIKLMEKEKEESYSFGEYYIPGSVAILSYEAPTK
jgi:hypothetical protein